MMDVTSIINNPIVLVVAVLIVAVFLFRKAYRKVMGLVFSALTILKLVHFLALLH